MQEALCEQFVKDRAARRGIELPETARLGEGEPEARHVDEFPANPRREFVGNGGGSTTTSELHSQEWPCISCANVRAAMGSARRQPRRAGNGRNSAAHTKSLAPLPVGVGKTHRDAAAGFGRDRALRDVMSSRHIERSDRSRTREPSLRARAGHVADNFDRTATARASGGLFAFDEPVDRSVLEDLDRLAEVMARHTPAWEPGTRQGYHGLTLGFYEGELMDRVDPRHRTLGQCFQDEIATALGEDVYIRLPEEIPQLPPGHAVTSRTDRDVDRVSPAERDLMRRQPRDPRAGIFTRPVLMLLLAGVCWSALVNISLFAWLLHTDGPSNRRWR